MPVSFPRGDPRKQLPRFRAAIQAASVRVVSETVFEVEKGAKRNLLFFDAVDRGILRNSGISSVRLLPGGGAEGSVAFTARHGPWVEFGRKGLVSSPEGTGPESATAAYPPRAPIEAWVRRRLNVQTRARASSRRGSGSVARNKEIARVAFLVARKIGLHGIRPRMFFYPVARRFMAPVRVRAALARSLNSEFRKVGLR